MIKESPMLRVTPFVQQLYIAQRLRNSGTVGIVWMIIKENWNVWIRIKESGGGNSIKGNCSNVKGTD